MKSFNEYKQIIMLIVVAAICFMIVNNLKAIFTISYDLYLAFLPLIIGLLMAFIIDIIVEKYMHIYAPNSHNKYVIASRRPVCIAGAIISIFFMIGLVLYLALPQTIHSISLAITYMPSIYDRLVNDINIISHQLPFVDQHLVDDIVSGKKLLDNISAYGTRWLSSVASTLSDVFFFVVNLVIGFVFSIYLLINKKELKEQGQRFMKAYFNPTSEGRIIYVFSVINKTFSSFFVGQFLDALILAVLVWFAMLSFGLPYALNIACVVGLTALIPLLGAYIGAFIGITMLLVENPLNAIIFIIILIVMQQIENNFIYPKVVGDSVGLPGVWVFAAIVVGGNLYGVIGILFSVPIAATAYRLLKDDINQRIVQ